MTPSRPVRYGVAHSASETGDLVYEAIRTRSLVTVNITTNEGARPLSFKVRTTDHDDEGTLILGTTVDDKIVNLHIPKEGDVYLNLQ